MDTGRETWKRIQELDLLPKRQMEVYLVIAQHGPITAIRVFEIMELSGIGSKIKLSNSASRFTELERKGVIERAGEEINPHTKMPGYKWKITKNLPVKSEKSKRIRCVQCLGRGFIEETQTKMF